jgi:hypothetical protein
MGATVTRPGVRLVPGSDVPKLWLWNAMTIPDTGLRSCNRFRRNHGGWRGRHDVCNGPSDLRLAPAVECRERSGRGRWRRSDCSEPAALGCPDRGALTRTAHRRCDSPEARSFSKDLRVSLIRSFFTKGARKNRSTVALNNTGSSNGTMCVAFGKMASWPFGMCW